MNMKNDLAVEKRNHEIVVKETTCTICGTTLSFTHFIDYCQHKVKESSTCPECGVRYEPKEHSLN
jgi:hypothetical protein